MSNCEQITKKKRLRWAKSIELRDLGLSVREISKDLGVCYSRARDILEQAIRDKLRPKSWTDDLPVRCKIPLYELNISTPEQAIAAIRSGKINPKAFHEYGKTSHRILCKWLGIELGKKRVCPNCCHEFHS